MEERNLDRLCDVCGARMARNARYCMRCGKPAALQPTMPDVARSCPRCRQPLRTRSIPDSSLRSVIECGACGGLWLAPDAIDRMCASAEAMQEATNELVVSRTAPVQIDAGKIAYLPCPDCRDFMVRRNFGGASGIIVDVCGRHGVWFDHAELEKVLQFVRAGGLMKARQREVERLAREAQRATEQRRAAMSGVGDPLTSRTGWDVGDLFGDLLHMFRGLS